jgi:MvaI/BcnI restriction endonuclease family
VLEIADRSISDVIAFFATYETEAGYLVPTDTGLEKSILDAHAGLREYLLLKDFHDYGKQGQGANAKRLVSGRYLTNKDVRETGVSLYRPETKSGDPRIWPYDLKKFAKPKNLLALIVHDSFLYIINTSDPNVLSNDLKPCQNLLHLLKTISNKSNEVAEELLNKIRNATQGGWVKTLRSGPTGVGFTFESLLGIKANSSRAPDYKGIEIKAGRQNNSKASSRSTLFSKTPDWSNSECRNGLELLNAYGYLVDGRNQLYCSLNHLPNSKGHFLEIRSNFGDYFLNSMHKDVASNTPANKVLQWDLQVLRNALAEKHKETFWVKAASRSTNKGVEEFQYTEIIHTKGPLLGNLTELFIQGHIELDYLLHEKISPNGKRSCRDHGYLFKMWPKNFDKLFPPPRSYKLVDN